MNQNKMKPAMALRVLGGIGLAIVSGGLTFSLAYFITKWFYNRTEIRLSDFLTHLVNWGLGSVIFLIVVLTIGLISRPRQIAIWSEIYEALKRIAKGDFNISLNSDEKYRGQFGQFLQAINHMAKDLKEIEVLRQEFISNVSHEIQSPLTSIRGFANAMKNDDLSLEERKHYLSIIETESTRLSRLSDNLLKLTSLESEHQPFDPRAYRLDIQLQNVILACEPQWLEKSLEVELELAETSVTADEELMNQVWMNLIHNAIKFTPSRGCLRIAIVKAENQVTVKITDSGIGISPEEQLRIFERFYKGDKSRNRSAGGSGLGLSIVKKIIDLHHGTIQVDSRLQAGSTFEVTLPEQLRK